MIINYDFITNSSSTSYILKIPNKVASEKMTEYIYGLPKHIFKGVKIFQIFSNKQSLVEFTQQRKTDWVSKVMGPSEYVSLNIHEYQLLRNALEERKLPNIIGYVDLSWGRQYDCVRDYCSKNSIKMIYLEDN